MVFSPFDFEKLCLKGGLEAKLFASLLYNGHFSREKQGSRENYFPLLYNQRTK